MNQSEVGHMRHNQNGRRFRGRNNSGGGNGNGNVASHQSHSNHHNNGGNRRVNPRVQTFDSNGPDVRIRGNALQINEKYLTLARDAQSAGDRVLAESYLQHAEHYQRMLNEMNEEFNRQQAQYQQHQPQQQRGQQHDMQDGQDQQDQPESHQQQHQQHRARDQQQDVAGSGEQPDVPLDDLDQGFLVGHRRNAQHQQRRDTMRDTDEPQQSAPTQPVMQDLTEGADVATEEAAPAARTGRRLSTRTKATEVV